MEVLRSSCLSSTSGGGRVWLLSSTEVGTLLLLVLWVNHQDSSLELVSLLSSSSLSFFLASLFFHPFHPLPLFLFTSTRHI